MARPRTLLAVAIGLEVAGTLTLRVSEGFTRPGWTVVVVASYVTSVVVFGRVLASGMTMGVAYGTLTAVGLVAAAAASAVLYREGLGPVAAAGLVLLLVGAVILQSAPAADTDAS